jgi:hypothetical protein
VLLLAACTLSPLQSRVDVGEDPFVLFLAEGTNGDTDLFVVEPGGGRVTRVTFTPLVEMSPRLSRQGGMVAFIRAADTTIASPRDVVVMNLINGAERKLDIPDNIGQPMRLAWSHDESALYLQTPTSTWRVAAPPAVTVAVEVAGAELVTADSAFAVMLGDPAFAVAAPCGSGGICVTGPNGEPNTLSTTGTGALRWGNDSLAWFDNDVLVVRPLGPGPARQVEWAAGQVRNPREASYATP